ncbi:MULTISPECIES: hypothetical protein [Metallosphaera]|uniref:Uncharacterized protein n=4 Tax=Metallosphaera TaxID=41980 RepID=A4YFU1_METS5|nr:MULTISPECIES: hypothetical protein [Metallosphaera]ABP95293.1 hypothetical protein Msed_1131 [Metallosphaera sedula DSM 5348]AIM27279.1 hypothetical protein HA72_1131 [Metallosphaera sedula]AKV83146.1 hypothetical protein MsedE_1150 [Metallosphaera sedula]MCY0862935.1 hypothetical protein [Metallosphaera prunae]WPX07322.1 hypothetical protein SOJ17_001084 [Metallosphaera sedula DSM 5348]
MNFYVMFVEGDCDQAFLTTLLRLSDNNSSEDNSDLFMRLSEQDMKLKQFIENFFIKNRRKYVRFKNDKFYFIFQFSQEETTKLLYTKTLPNFTKSITQRFPWMKDRVNLMIMLDCDSNKYEDCSNKIRCEDADPRSDITCRIIYVKCKIGGFSVHSLVVMPNMENLLQVNEEEAKGRKAEVCKDLTLQRLSDLEEIFKKCVLPYFPM